MCSCCGGEIKEEQGRGEGWKRKKGEKIQQQKKDRWKERKIIMWHLKDI